MAEAVAEKTKIKDDEFDIHGDLAVTQSDDKSFVVLYDSSKTPNAGAVGKNPPSPTLDDIELPPLSDLEPSEASSVEPPHLHEINEDHALHGNAGAHPEDAYIDEILSSDDIELPDMDAHAPVGEMHAAPEAAPAAMHDDDDGPIALSNEELDGILEMGPATEEEFHPDFPPAEQSAAEAPVMPEEPPAVAESAYDEDELPIALSDEDLDEILLEEEGGESVTTHAAPAAPQVTATAPQLAPAIDEDEEPIALSDDELDHILADAEAGHADAHGESVPPIEDEILTLDEEPELTLIDDAAPTERHAGAPGEHSRAATQDFFDSDEDEPITLSDEELDGILSTAPEEEAPRQTQEVALSELPDDGVVEVQDEHPKAAAAHDDDDEPVALSADELDGILMDAEEAPHDTSLAELPPDMEAPAPSDESSAPKGFFDSDEDEPIALSADELDGIAATATHEDHVPELAELPPDESAAGVPIDERYADVDSMDASTPGPETEDGHGTAAPAAHGEEDDGPIALSSDELDGIVADAREVTPEAPMIGLSPLDTGGNEQSLAENKDKPSTVFEEDLEASTLIHEDDKAAAAASEVQPDTEELKSVMTYLDNLLGELPDDVIEKFAQSEYFKLYQKIMDRLGL
ncbi:MAG: hypothetical protein U1F16_08855 [Turneriella sp.]